MRVKSTAPRSRLSGDDWQIYVMMLPAAALILLFSYVPMWGIVLGFQNYRAGSPLFAITGVDWVGLKWIRQ
ncbi:MAG TPA: sugar ABC transporter permease, partial [Clostridia bacterium]|nr:sugar ABC transporter permease [Clostridia bacterium]